VAPAAEPPATIATRGPDAPPEDATSGEAAAPDASSPPDFLRELVAAMRKVADDARFTGIEEIRAQAEVRVQRLDADVARRQAELRERAETDIAGVADWAKAEAERIRVEAEGRVAARRAQLEQQIAAEASRGEAEAASLRARVSDYERELDAYHARLAEINDPAAFAAAAKRMPRPPTLDGAPGLASAAHGAPPAVAEVPSETATASPSAEASNGVARADEIHPAEEEVLTARLAELETEGADDAAAQSAGEPTTTEIVVKGLGSFGAITGFRQALSGVKGIDGVALSLGNSGEFIFRASHLTSFDVGAAIRTLEGDGAKVEPRPEGGLVVTLDRAR
jgi:hypothetical protein